MPRVRLVDNHFFSSATELIAAWDEHEKLVRKPTPWNELGPFYKKSAPQTASLRAPGDAGMPLSVSGQVFDVRGEIVPGAKIESGRPITSVTMNLDGYRYRATLIGDSAGKYFFESVIPGHYSGSCVPAHSLPCYRSRPQADHDTALFRDRSGVRRRPQSQLPSRATVGKCRTGAASCPSWRPEKSSCRCKLRACDGSGCDSRAKCSFICCFVWHLPASHRHTAK